MPAFFPRYLQLLAAAALAGPAIARAQGAGYASPAAAPPVVVIGPHANLVAGTPAALVAASDSAAVVRVLARCIPSPGDSAAIAHGTAPAGTGMTDPPDHVLVAIVPASAYLAASCDTRILAGPALLARGLQYAAANGYDARTDLTGAAIVVGGRRIEPTDVERLPARVIPAPGPDARTPSWLVLAIPAGVLAPDAAGRFPDVEVRTTTVDSAGADRFSLSAAQLRALWDELIPARLASSPRAATALARTRAPRARREELRAARVDLAAAALSAGDTAAARVVLRDALADAPCLTMPAGQAEYNRMLDAMRPPARCTTIPARRIVLRGLVPGLALQTVGRPGPALANGVATALVAGAGFGFLSEASTAHEHYMAARNVDDAKASWQRATNSRETARTAFGVAAGVWVAGIATALVSERAYGRELAAVRRYDARARVGVVPGPRGSAQLMVALQW